MEMQIEQMSEKEREEIIRYGIKRGKVIFLSTLITLLLGAFIGVIWQSIIFWLSLSMLRKYAGGYHADTEIQCYAISFITVIISLFAIKLLNYKGTWSIVVQTIISLIIWFLAPVENTNHILDIDEKKIYGIRTKIIVIVLYFAYIFLYFINKTGLLNSIGMANLAVMSSLIAGCIKNKKFFTLCD